MGYKYRINDNDKLYFITLTIVDWVDIFIRDIYREIFYSSINYCQKHKGLEVYSYCIMTNHIHLIIGSELNNLSYIIRDLKAYVSKTIRETIQESQEESRKSWMIEKFTIENSYKIWTDYNKPITILSEKTFYRILEYIHNNPVKAGFVENPEDWLHSSAGDYLGTRIGRIKLHYI